MECLRLLQEQVCVCVFVTSLCKGVVPFHGVGGELPCFCLPLARYE
jgi:hypothetical protein